MTDRIYYTDALAVTFDARVVSCDPVNGAFAVVLDRTAFYPTSGGQPYDTGRLGDAAVRDVVDRDDGAVVHVVGAPIAPGAAVRGEIDWPRRFDHMQQHTGQHILSAAFLAGAGAATVSFHLGAEAATIDLAREVGPDAIAAAVRSANAVVWDDRPVGVRIVSAAEAAALPLRKDPARRGPLRIVEVPGCDVSACGGTHVPSTGRIGIIAVSGWERFKAGTRVTFLCGGRALAAFDRLRDVVAGLTRALSVGAADLAPAVDRLRGGLRDAAKQVRQAREELAGHRAAALVSSAESIGGHRVVIREEADWDVAALRTLATALASGPGVVALLLGGGHPVPVVIARSEGVPFDCHAWMAQAVAVLGGRGGGRPELAQGGLAADAGAIRAFAREALARA